MATVAQSSRIVKMVVSDVHVGGPGVERFWLFGHSRLS